MSKIYHMGIPGDIIEGKAGRDHAPSWKVTHNIMAMESMTPGKIVDSTLPLGAPEVFPDGAEALAESPRQRRALQDAGDRPGGNSRSMEVADVDAGLMADTMAANEAIELLRERGESEQPFFLAVGFVRPHFPFVATDSSIAPYDADRSGVPGLSRGRLRGHAAAGDRLPGLPFPEQDIKELRRGYFGAVSFMDQQFGRLMAELDRLELRDDTIVVFVSDHGYLIGEHEMHKKSKLWEEAIHVPLMISVPRALEGGASLRSFCRTESISIPPFAELAGLPGRARGPGTGSLTLPC